MPIFKTVSYTDTGTKESLNLDPSIAPFQVTASVNLSSTGNYKLQFSLDPMTVADADAVWQDSVNIPSGTTSSAVTAIISPITRVRTVIAANGGIITVQLYQGISVN